MKNIAVLTSGGDAPGMNAAIRSVVRIGLHEGLNVYGIRRGYAGLIHGEFVEMEESSVSDIMQRGGTILQTARCEEFKTDEGLKKAIAMANKFAIDGLVVIGGNGSFNGAYDLEKRGFPCIGIPGTIDNDLAYTDFTIGFDTAVNNVLDAINKIRDTSSSHQRVSIIEVMGRNCGDIAIYSGLAGGAEVVIVPEVEYKLEDICNKLMERIHRGKLHSIIILAEGAGNSKQLEQQIMEKVNIEVRSTVLGYTQRGGNPSAFDRIFACRLGERAVALLLQEKTGRLVGIKKNEIIDVEIAAALAMERNSSMELIALLDKLQ